MIKNYITIAWRGALKNKISSLINIGGLAAGMAVTLLIGLWINDELSYNKSFENYPHIAQVMQHQNFSGDIRTDKAIPIPLADKLRQEFGCDFKYVILSSWTNSHILSYQEKHLSQPGNFMEPDAAAMLTLKMNLGSRTGLDDPSSILLSQSVSEALFGNNNPVGKVIKLDTTNLKVAGVYEDIPSNNNFNTVSFIAPWNLYAASEDVRNAKDDWGTNSFQLFVQIADGGDMQKISSKIKDAKRRSIGEEAVTLKPVIFLQPMSRWHLYTEFKNGINTGGAVQYVWMFGMIGVFVLLLACINFMNLSTARSEKRGKEVGIRKTVGSLRSQLVGQFFCESLLFAFAGFACSLTLVQLVLPFFNDIAGKKMAIFWSNPTFWLLGVAVSLVTGIIAGSYPALYLSSFQPMKVLKGTFRAGRYSAVPRKILVVIQFSVSVILIIGTVIVLRQIQFAKTRPVGYDREGLMIIRPYSEDFHNHLDAVRNDLINTGFVTQIAEGSFISKGSRTAGGLKWKGKNPAVQDNFMTFGVSVEYGKTVGWEVVDGRDFSSKFSTDSSGLILNEAAARYMGLKNPVGEIIGWDKQYTVIGVTKDIVMKSPFDPPVPTIYYISAEANYLNIKIKTGVDEQKALGKIEAIYKKYSPSAPFEYKIADEEFSKKFAEEERIRNLSGVFAILAIFISCLGIFGLASFVAEQRTKEIGIRKIMGASVLMVWGLISKDFVILVAISLCIAMPVAWYFMDYWLQQYQYRTGLSWWIFAMAGAGALLITLLTVSFQTIKASVANPVKSLRTE